jgi:hypothetical protein
MEDQARVRPIDLRAARRDRGMRRSRSIAGALALALTLLSGMLPWFPVQPPPATAAGPDCQAPHDTSPGSTCTAIWNGHQVGTLTVDNAHPAVGDIIRLTVKVDYPPAQTLIWEYDPGDDIDHLVGTNIGTDSVALRFPGGRLVRHGQPANTQVVSSELALSSVYWAPIIGFEGCVTLSNAVQNPSLPVCNIYPGSELWAEFEILSHEEIPATWFEPITAAERPFVGARKAGVWFDAITDEFMPDPLCPEQCVTLQRYGAFRRPGPGQIVQFWPQPTDPRAQVYLADPRITGTVVDAKGRPMPGRAVNIYQTDQATDDPCASDPKPTPLRTAHTSSEGAYSVAVDAAEFQVCPRESLGIEPRSRRVSTEFDDHAIADFRFEAFRLSGQVTDDAGDGVPSAMIDVRPVPADPANPPQQLQVSGDGLYEVWLVRGTYEVRATAEFETCDAEGNCLPIFVAAHPEVITADLTSDDAFADFELGANQAPTATANITQQGPSKLHYLFDGSDSDDPDGEIVTWRWGIGKDGLPVDVLDGEQVEYDFPELGTYIVSLVVTDDLGKTGVSNVQVVVTPASLAASITSIDPAAAKVGGEVTVRVRLTNTGDVAVDDVTPHLWVQGPSGPQVELTNGASFPVPFPAGDFVNLAFPGFKPTEPGTYEFQFEAVGTYEGAPVSTGRVAASTAVEVVDPRVEVFLEDGTAGVPATSAGNGDAGDRLVGDLLRIEGSGWDPDGGPIELFMAGHGAGDDFVRTYPAAAEFADGVFVDFPIITEGSGRRCANEITIRQDGVTRTITFAGEAADLIAYAYDVEREDGTELQSNTVECAGWKPTGFGPDGVIVVQDFGGGGKWYWPPDHLHYGRPYHGLWIYSPGHHADTSGLFGDIELTTAYPEHILIDGPPAVEDAPARIEVFGPLEIRSDNIVSLSAHLIVLGGVSRPRELAAPAAAGTNRLDVDSTGLQPGDRFRVNQGTATQEDVTMGEHGSIITTAPLRFAHAAGEPVVRLLPGAPGTCALQAQTTAEQPLDGTVRCPDDGDLRYTLISGADHGQVAIGPDGAFTYTPAAGFVGEDRFTFRAVHASSTSSATIGDTGPITFRVTVAQPNRAPVCQPVSGAVAMGGSVDLTPSCTDLDGNPLTYEIVSAPASGTASVVAGQLRYTAGGSAGTATFTYRANDGTATSSPATATVTITQPASLTVSAALVKPATSKLPAVIGASGRLTPAAGQTLACGRDVTVRFGALTETIPGARMQKVLGVCVYVRPKNGGYLLTFTLDPKKGSWTLTGTGSTPSFSPYANPLTVGLASGPVTASTSVTLTRHGDTWTYPH